MMEMRSTQLLLSASLICCLGGCAAGHRASLEIRPLNAPHMVKSDTPAIERGRDLLALGQQAEAISAFRAALREEPNSAEAHNGLAIAYDRIGRKDLARRYFELAVAESPQDTKYRANLARFFESNGQAELAFGLTGELATTATDDLPAIAVAGREFEVVAAVTTATEAELATIATDDPIAAIVADLAMLPTTDVPQTASAAIARAIAPKLRAAPAVFRPSATTLIKACL
jgi:tetratricopeptide (TPR) repeat protein